MGSNHENLLIHTGNILSCFFNSDQKSCWLLILEYLADILWCSTVWISIYEELQLQSFLLDDKISAFTCKLDMWEENLWIRNYNCLQTVQPFIIENDTSSHDVVNILCSHLKNLKEKWIVLSLMIFKGLCEFKIHLLMTMTYMYSYKHARHLLIKLLAICKEHPLLCDEAVKQDFLLQFPLKTSITTDLMFLQAWDWSLRIFNHIFTTS